MPEDARAEIERRDLHASVPCEIQSQQGIHEGKGLNGLLGIKVVPSQLVGEVQPWPDDGDALHRSGREDASGLHRIKRALDPEVDENRGVGRQSTIAKHRQLVREVR